MCKAGIGVSIIKLYTAKTLTPLHPCLVWYYKTEKAPSSIDMWKPCPITKSQAKVDFRFLRDPSWDTPDVATCFRSILSTTINAIKHKRVRICVMSFFLTF